ncbi:hypothetical protein ABT093_28640 [Kitasatospora sp. NPDC002551]|uniref:hypothetical protein n=1 Tax=unclassified Kitasatospora TaxID=2633591 RepID=UPI00331DD40F
MVNRVHPVLSGLGRNPAAPQDVLVRLAAHPDARTSVAWRRGRLADPVVEALLTHGGADIAVALHGDRLSPAMRRRIAGHADPEIRDAYPDFIRQMVDRGTPMSVDSLEEAYGLPRTDLAGAPSPALRAAVARCWPDRPAAVQRKLLADPDPTVRAAATERQHPGVPPEFRDRCLADPDPAVRANVARHVPLTPDQFDRLIRTGDEFVLQSVAGNPHLSAEMVARFLDLEDPSIRVMVAYSRHTDAATRAGLLAPLEAERAAGSTAAMLALGWTGVSPDWLRAAPLDERLTYLDCPHPAFRRVLASCPDLPDEAWQRLDDDPDVRVRRIAARRPDAPPEVLERLVRTHGENFHLRPLLVEHPNFPRRALRTLVDEPDPRVRRVALEDPDLPVPALHRLATSPEPSLRRGAARHPNITHALLTPLLQDPLPEVADDAAANPALPPPEMYRILAEAGL